MRAHEKFSVRGKRWLEVEHSVSRGVSFSRMDGAGPLDDDDVAVRLHLRSGERRAYLEMTPEEARRLSDDLRRMAEQAQERRPAACLRGDRGGDS